MPGGGASGGAGVAAGQGELVRGVDGGLGGGDLLRPVNWRLMF